MTKFFRIGKILKQQGVKGEAKVSILSSDIDRYKRLNEVYIIKDEDNEKDLSDEKVYKVEQVKYLNDAVVIKFFGLDKIEDIFPFIGYSLYVKRDDAINIKDGEYFIPDLIGLQVVDTNKSINGKIVDVMINEKSGKIINTNLVIELNNKKTFLLPFAKDFIENINFEKNIITIKLIEGILDI